MNDKLPQEIDESNLPGNPQNLDSLYEQSDTKSEMDKILEHLLKPENIYHNTELSEEEITAYSTIGPLALKHDLRAVKEFMVQKLQMRVSKNRQGKQELIKIVSRGMNNPMDVNQQRPGFWNMFRR